MILGIVICLINQNQNCLLLLSIIRIYKSPFVVQIKEEQLYFAAYLSHFYCPVENFGNPEFDSFYSFLFIIVIRRRIVRFLYEMIFVAASNVGGYYA
jgi:hypothetical protein